MQWFNECHLCNTTTCLAPFSCFTSPSSFLSGVAHPGDPLPRGGQKLSSCLHGPHYSAHPHRGRYLQSLHPWGGGYFNASFPCRARLLHPVIIFTGGGEACLAFLYALSACDISLPLTGAEEHFVVHGEIVDGDLTRQLAHPGGHPHHPVQHDANKGRFVTSRVKSKTVEQCGHLQVIISKK